ncbi:hypothetical protein [Teichococcus wenyumeiae]|nr:hypothetical protein [Pseudoroseomonas wenyumeiae]
MALQTVPSPASTALQARPDAASATPGYILAGATDISTRLAPETPGCPEMGVSGRLPGHQRVADLEPRAGGPKHQARPRLNNPLSAPQTLRPAMHMCVVDQFSPNDLGGARKTVYRL